MASTFLKLTEITKTDKLVYFVDFKKELAKMAELTQEIVKELLDYNPETGVFIWRFRERRWFSTDKAWKIGNSRFSGKTAGCLDKTSGYLIIGVLGKEYRAHRLAWLYMHGEFPKSQIDHINHVRTDNRITNLRQVSNHENAKNQRMRNNNTSGVTGVYWYESRNKWVAHITINGKYKNLGYYTNKADAITARKAAEAEYGFHENHGKEE